ncbi:MAG: S8 family peptidase [Roseiflexaceae bacterium]|nr:S8 family peptidase [Roseiflexaceae bacterium]
MPTFSITRRTQLLLAACVLLAGAASSSHPIQARAETTSYIVQADSAAAAATAVARAGGGVVDQLNIIDGVSARLDQRAYALLATDQQLALHADLPVHATGGGKETDTDGYLLYPAAATGANLLHERKVPTAKTECKEGGDKKFRVNVSSEREDRELQGWGITIAVIDSGFMQMASAGDWKYRDTTGLMVSENSGRCIFYRDFLPRDSANDNLLNRNLPNNSSDQHGHGTHVAATIADNRETELASGTNATPVGVAPQVNLMVARALDKNGVGSYADVIRSIDWIVANRAAYNVRVLNLSLYSPVTGPYWDDPLNQAVMKAWQAGIVVIAAAGNSGPEAATITVPGNVPYVVTVGAIKSGRYTESGYDELATYSSRGPTESAFIKPDVVVPASRTIAPMPNGSTLANLVADGAVQEQARVDFKVGSAAKEHTYYRLSGTSMAAAQVSGIVALMLQEEPSLTNDQVKHRLLATARPAFDEDTQLPIYSVWEQGAGLIDAEQAVFSTATESANAGLDVGIDLTTDDHFWGFTTWDEASGQFSLIDSLTGEQLATWTGGRQSWAGGRQSWAGGRQSWAGGRQSWAGGRQSWAGGRQSWAGAVAPATTSSAARVDLLVE